MTIISGVCAAVLAYVDSITKEPIKRTAERNREAARAAVLCGEDSRAHIFTSDTRLLDSDGPTIRSANRPRAVVEVLDPMVLSSRVREACDRSLQEITIQIPKGIRQMFDEDLVLAADRRRLFVTLGQFSIIRLERDAQLIVPWLNYAVPTKECCETPGCCQEDPCEMFSRIPFPTQQFAPRGCDGDADHSFTADGCGCKS